MELLFTGEFPPLKGGIGNFVYSRCANPPTDGLRVLAASSAGDRDWDSQSGITIERFHYVHGGSIALRLRQLMWARRSLSKELRHRSYRVITTNVALPFGWAASTMKRRGHRLAVFCHGCELLRPRFSRPANYLLNQTVKHTDLFVANSRLTADIVMQMGVPAQRIEVINPPIDATRFHPGISGDEFRDTWGDNGRFGPLLLTVSRLDDIGKGIDTVLRLLPRLRDRFPEIRYVVVGQGTLRPYYENMIRSLGIEQHVVFAGSVSDRDLPACYAACDVFVLLSRKIPEQGYYEGFGIASREAMACGKAIVVSREAGIGDIVQSVQNGLLVSPRDDEEIFHSLTTLLSDSSVRAEMGRNAVQAAAAQPDWSALNSLGM